MGPYGNCDVITLKKSDIKICFHDAKTNLISFELSNPMNIDSPNGQSFKNAAFELDQQPIPQSLSKFDRSQFYLFFDFSFNYFHNVEFKQMKSNKDLCSKLADCQNRRREVSPTISSLYEINYKTFLRSYIYFLNEYHFKEKKFKKFIRSQ